MLSQNPEQRGGRTVSISMETVLDMARRLSGFQNVDLLLQEKDAKIKSLKQVVKMLQSKLMALEKMVSVSEAERTAEAGIQHRSSAPAIFVYPDMSKKCDTKNYDSLTTRGSSLVIRNGGSKIESTTNLQQNKANKVVDKDTNIVPQKSMSPVTQRNDGASVDRNDMMVPQQNYLNSSTGGVSELYFNNVVNELVRTKQYLYELEKQMKEKLAPKENTDGEDALRQEIKELHRKYEQVQRENVLLKMPNQETEKKKKNSQNDSFEIEQSNPQTAEKLTQTDGVSKDIQVISPEMQKLQSQVAWLNNERNELLKQKEAWKRPGEIQRLSTENESLHKQLEQTTVLYNQLKESVKVLSTCVHEEKERYKQLHDRFRDKTVENTKLSEMMAHMRQKFEELRQEKNALEKEKRLSLSDYQHSGSRCSSNESTGSGYVLPFTRVQTETEVHQEFPCYNCLQVFNTEGSYMKHIGKCCVD